MSEKTSDAPSGVPDSSDSVSHSPYWPSGVTNEGRPSTAGSHFPSTLESTEDSVMKMLSTPWESVYAISTDGQTYLAPVCLRGTPVAKLEENNPYWESSWESLDEFINKEPQEEELKRQYHDRLAADPRNQGFSKRYKFHQDNVSKHRKIREIFGGNSQYHPNQLVAKHHLPAGGLCHKEIMYRVACKISDLQVLKARGELSMDPWDFLRWRIGRKANSLLTSVGASARDNIKTIIYKICDDSSSDPSNQYEDVLLRKAILRSARYSGRLNSYGGKCSGKSETLPGRNLARVLGANSRTRIGPATRIARAQETSTPSTRASRSIPRRERPSRPSEYQGVNAYRAQRQQDSQPKGSK